MMRKSLAAFTAALVPLFSAPAAMALDGVVASIKPVHSLVAAVMEGVAKPQLLVKGAGSPHTYSMRPSEAAMLEEAQVIFWTGPGLELFLEAPLETLAGKASIVSLSETPGLTLLDMREGGAFEAHEHEDEAGHHHDHQSDAHHSHAHDEHVHDDHGHGEHEDGGALAGKDMHIWLDPENARLLVRRIAAVLSEEDPGNVETYQANAGRLEARLDAFTAEAGEILAGVREEPFVVFHDAYHYFEHRFGLSAAGSITVSPEVAPGARRLAEIREKIIELGASCVFSEPQFEPKLIDSVTEGTNVRTGVLDPLGADIDNGPELYFALMGNLARSLADCLSTR